MNDQGKEFIRRAESNRRKDAAKIKWTDSVFQERLLRIGVEMSQFEVHLSDTDDVYRLVVASLADLEKQR